MKYDEKKTAETNKAVNTIDGAKLIRMFKGALKALEEQKSYINSLNVFPVPDGDTGTNMLLTLKSACEKFEQMLSDNVAQITSAVAQGALMGARGNSGVILSQLLRGFSEANEENEVITRGGLVASLKKASSVAYQGVMKPVEGTILTVARRAAEGAELAHQNELNMSEIMENTIEFARKALNKTPEQLPELKEAGVVDAGGQGYLVILEGMLTGFQGKEENIYTSKTSTLEVVSDRSQTPEEDFGEDSKTDSGQSEVIKYAYDTQTLIEFSGSKSADIEQIREDLENFGDSLIVVGSGNTVKVHIHTNHPGIVLEYALKKGTLKDIVVENMKKQAREKEKEELQKDRHENQLNVDEKNSVSEMNQNKKKQGRGLVAVARGEGFEEIFKDLGVDKIIKGGNTSNPSTKEFVKAIEELNNDEVVILPNNKNVISAAQQVESLVEEKVTVVETRSIPEAIASLMVYNEELALQELKSEMESEFTGLKTLQITKAVKDSKVNGLQIKKDDIIGIYNGDIVVSGQDYFGVISDLFAKYFSGTELVTIYYGSEISPEKAADLKSKLQDEFPVEEIEIYSGSQPLYPFIISLE